MKHINFNFLFGFFVLFFVCFTSANAQNANVPYFCDFENPTENAKWVIPTSSTANKWLIGSGITASSPINSAYITNNGTSATYSNVANTLPFYREFNTIPGQYYRITFDCKVGGDVYDYGSGYIYYYDYLGVYWVDNSSVNVSTWAKTSYTEPTGASTYNIKYLYGVTAWTTYSIIVPCTSSTAKLVFLWGNDAYTPNNPPGGCIDNVKVEISETGPPTPIWVNDPADKDNDNKLFNTYTPEELVKKVFIKGGDCSVENVTFKGLGWNSTTQQWTSTTNVGDRSLGYFSHGTEEGLGMKNGLVLVTGNIKDAKGPNTLNNGMIGGLVGTDADLNGLLTSGYTAYTISILEFDFYPSTTAISFDYIFASEEWPSFTCTGFNDVFGFFISGPGISGNKNIALVPGTNLPVSINSVNDQYCGSANVQYYVPAAGNIYTQFNAHTKMFTTATQTVQPGQKYHLKLAVANVNGDNWYGSGVFLRTGSLDLGLGITNLGGMVQDMDNVFEGCGENQFTIKLDNNSPNPVYITLNYSGAAVNDIVSPDGTPLPTSVVIPPGESEVVIPYKINSPVSVNGGDFNIDAQFEYCQTGDGFNHTIYVYKKATPSFDIYTPCGSPTGTVSVITEDGTPNLKLSIDNSNVWNYANGFSTSLPEGPHKILFKDSIGCGVDTFYIVVPPHPTANTTISKEICQDQIYNFGGKDLNATGIYYDTLQMSNGCDSVITLNLTVKTTFEETINATICDNDLYEFNGQILSSSGTYIAELKTMNGCDSIVTLILEKFDNRVTIQIEEPICSDAGEFTFTLSQNSDPDAVMPTDYKVDFAEKTVPEGFVSFSTQQGTVNNSEIKVQIPEKLYPDVYSCTVTLSNINNSCAANSYTINYVVLYPTSIMEQKWGDVIAILNNTGFKFAGYQWYHGSDELLNENKSYLYIKDGSLVENDAYYVQITREDGSKILSCPFKAKAPNACCSDYPTVISGGSSMIISFPDETATVRFITVTGIVISSKTVNSGDEIATPTQQGVYLLEILSSKNAREVTKVIVK